MLRSVVRPRLRAAVDLAEHATRSGARGLAKPEPLLFDIGSPGRMGIDLPRFAAPTGSRRLGDTERDPEEPTGLPDLSEHQVLRHYFRLSQLNYSIESGFFPLGSCTMKYNPRVNEWVARLPGFAQTHPLQPPSTLQGAYAVIAELSHWLLTLTAMKAVATIPAAGAHGELCGLMAIRQALVARGEYDQRRVVLVPESAHGTNPASAAMCGFRVREITAGRDGRVNMEDLHSKLGDDVAGIMLTNPNTCGLFETDIISINKAVHDAGGFVYMDGANFNALLGRVRIADLGVDAMHINLHKTFSTPHGGGGPGAGPVVLSERLAPYAPLPFVRATDEEQTHFELVDSPDQLGEGFNSLGRMKAYMGQMGMFTRAVAFMRAHGAEGLRQISGDAVLNANYLRVKLRSRIKPGYKDQMCMHEVCFSDSFLKGTGVTTLDIAKALVDEGYHPMTMYFPLVVHGALLIEPTETESKATLDEFIDVMLGLAERAQRGDQAEWFRAKPVFSPVRRCDETLAARKPILRWTPELSASRQAES